MLIQYYKSLKLPVLGEKQVMDHNVKASMFKFFHYSHYYGICHTDSDIIANK